MQQAGQGAGAGWQRAGLTHPARCSRALLPSAGTENNKVIALWDVVREPCIKHATVTNLIVLHLACEIQVKKDMHAKQTLCQHCQAGYAPSDRLRCVKGRRALQALPQCFLRNAKSLDEGLSYPTEDATCLSAARKCYSSNNMFSEAPQHVQLQ